MSSGFACDSRSGFELPFFVSFSSFISSPLSSLSAGLFSFLFIIRSSRSSFLDSIHAASDCAAVVDAGAVVTLSPSHASELGWTSSSSASFSPFSSKTFFLPPTDIRDSQGNRHLSCSLGLVPPYPGHEGHLVHSHHKDGKTQGGIPRSLPPATSNRLPFLLQSLNPRDTSASASALFLSRFVCGTPTQPSWREWRKVHPLMATSNVSEKKNSKEDEERKASEANDGVEGSAVAGKNKGVDGARRDTEKQKKRSREAGGGGEAKEQKEGSSASIGSSRIADIVAFLESANETSDDDDLTLDPRLYIALLIALSKLFFIRETACLSLSLF